MSNVHDLVNDGLINIQRYESTLHALLGFTEDTPVKKCIVGYGKEVLHNRFLLQDMHLWKENQVI